MILVKNFKFIYRKKIYFNTWTHYVSDGIKKSNCLAIAKPNFTVRKYFFFTKKRTAFGSLDHRLNDDEGLWKTGLGKKDEYDKEEKGDAKKN
jgi:hypothetical protein